MAKLQLFGRNQKEEWMKQFASEIKTKARARA
jgi:hypothetical protein